MNEDSEGALNADMLERLGVPIDKAHKLGWRNIRDWVRHLDQRSAYWRYYHKDEAAFSSMFQVANLLADLYDLINAARRDGKKGARKAEPYPRPFKEKRRIGRGAIPVSEFDAWYYGG